MARARVGNGPHDFGLEGADDARWRGLEHSRTGRRLGGERLHLDRQLRAARRPFDWGESVIKFAAPTGFPTNPGNYFAPTNWASLNQADLDLASSSPALLPNNLVYADGKGGIGYLLSSTKLGGVGGQLFESRVCGSYGGDARIGNTLFVTCSDGVRAVSVNTTKATFSTAWRGPADANGSPIVAGGPLWVPAYNSSRLYGLDTKSGAVAVNQPTPAMEHFTSPAASNGRLYLATGHTVEAYAIAQP